MSTLDKIAETAERHGNGWVACEATFPRLWGPVERRGIQAWFSKLPGTDDVLAKAERVFGEAA